MNGVGEMQECSSVTLTEVTDGESKKLILDAGNTTASDRLVNLAMPAAANGIANERLRTASTTTRNDDIIRNVDVAEPLFVAEDRDFGDLPTDNASNSLDRRGGRSDRRQSEDYDKIFWENGKFHQAHVVAKATSQKTHEESIMEEREASALEQKQPEDEYLGPTQDVQVKGIFD